MPSGSRIVQVVHWQALAAGGVFENFNFKSTLPSATLSLCRRAAIGSPSAGWAPRASSATEDSGWLRDVFPRYYALRGSAHRNPTILWPFGKS